MDKYSILFFIGLGLMFSTVLLFVGFMITQSFPDDVYSFHIGLIFVVGLILLIYGFGKRLVLADEEEQSNERNERHE